MTKASWTLSSSSNMWKIYDQKHYVHDRSRKMFEIYDSKYMTIMFMNIFYVIKYMTNIWPNKLREHYLDNGISEFWWTLYCFWIGEKKYILGTHWWEKNSKYFCSWTDFKFRRFIYDRSTILDRLLPVESCDFCREKKTVFNSQRVVVQPLMFGPVAALVIIFRISCWKIYCHGIG